MVHLPCAPASVGFARRTLSDDLRAAGVFDQAISDAALVISELVSNAILHAYPLPGERLQVAWTIADGVVEVEVSDGGSATMPHAGQPTVASVSGRGLAMTTEGYSRPVPAQEAILHLKGRTHCAAPIIEFGHTVYMLEGDVKFAPERDGQYVIKGEPIGMQAAD